MKEYFHSQTRPKLNYAGASIYESIIHDDFLLLRIPGFSFNILRRNSHLKFTVKRVLCVAIIRKL